MANVKLSKKQLLEELQARLVLLRKKKISQQELLDKCIQFSVNHLHFFFKDQFAASQLTEEKLQKILADTVDSEYFFPEKSDDELMYGV